MLVLLAAMIAVGGVLRLRWLSQVLGDDAATTLSRGIALRERKARFLALSMLAFGLGFSCYCLAIAQLLIAA